MSGKNIRVELHVQTSYCINAGVRSVADFLESAWSKKIAAVAVTDYMSVRIYPEAYTYSQKMADSGRDMRLVSGCKILAYNDSVLKGSLKAVQLLVYPRNSSGLQVLYKLLSQAYTYSQPHILLSDLVKYKPGLIIVAASELAAKLVSDDHLFPDLAGLTDYLEVCPALGHKLVYEYCQQAQQYNIPVIATSAALMIEQSDAVHLDIVREDRNRGDGALLRRLYSKADMDNYFSFLGYMSYEIVYANPQKLIDSISLFAPFAGLSPQNKSPDKSLGQITGEAAHKYYGPNLPDQISRRVNYELEVIQDNGLVSNILLAHELAGYCLSEKIAYYCQSNINSLLITWLLGINEVNPLPSHYICTKCHYIMFCENYASGFDMFSSYCPHCGALLVNDGHNIPANIVYCNNDPLLADITFFVAPGRRIKLLAYMQNKFGSEKVICAGYRPQNLRNKLVPLPIYFIVPSDKNYYNYTPVYFPESQLASHLPVAQLPEKELSNHLPKITILQDEKMRLEQYIADHNVKDNYSQPFAVSLLLTAVQSLRLEKSKVKNHVNLQDIPEFGFGIIREIIPAVNPVCFSDLLRALAWANGIGTWPNNAQTLLNVRKYEPSELIATKEDLYHELRQNCADGRKILPLICNTGQESGIRKKHVAQVKLITTKSWYAASYAQISYLPGRAIIVVKLFRSLRHIWYKHCHNAVFTASRSDSQSIDPSQKPTAANNTFQEKPDREQINRTVYDYVYRCSNDLLPVDEQEIFHLLDSLPEGTIEHFRFQGSYPDVLSFLEGLLINFQSGYLLFDVSSALSISSILHIWYKVEEKADMKLNFHIHLEQESEYAVIIDALLLNSD